MTRQLTLTCKSASGNAWTETYLEGERASFPVGHPDPAQWGRDLVAHFNATLRPSEQRREVLAVLVEEVATVPKLLHRWEKTNLVTILRGSRSYDTARCVVCGVTAKRFGVGEQTRDPKFKAEVYATCNGAIEALARRKAGVRK